METVARCVECGEQFVCSPLGTEAEVCSDDCARRFAQAVLEDYGTRLHAASTARRAREQLGVEVRV